ncbi:radical SAM protein [Sedimentibacter sp. zth1]|uniref:radical SAM/SPASM domain-containing protein n=1 Tax=Sedimentibacter sp. zth1 TaxID=2816908 RepID=UPI001A933C2B|nr:radical SAM protein [Sedimentibacter sp. zth1]QSX05566.1 radical SAM protein [Sedimentibacter sp. zth1]
MVILKNIIIKYKEKVLIMNLITFRRKFISYGELDLLISIYTKLKNNESHFSYKEKTLYDNLINERQILSDEIIELFDKKMNEIRKQKIKDINYNISESIQIDITDECNFNCVYCYQKKYSSKNRRLEIKDIKNIRKVCEEYVKKNNYKYKINRVVIAGGESILENNIPIIWEIANTFKDAKLVLLTNGFNLSKLFYDLPYTRIAEIQVSLDGNNNIISNLSLNGQNINAYERIVDGIKLAIENNINIIIHSLINIENVNNIENFINDLEQNNILNKIKLVFSPISNFCSDVDIDTSFYSIDKFIDCYRKLGKIQKMYNNIILEDFKSLVLLENNIIRKINEKPNYRFCRCIWEKGLVLVFSTDKNIYWCTKTDDNVGVVGDFINNMSIDIDAVKAILNRGIYTIEECKKCDFRYVCNGGCILYSYNKLKNINTPYCGCLKNERVLNNLQKLLI